MLQALKHPGVVRGVQEAEAQRRIISMAKLPAALLALACLAAAASGARVTQALRPGESAPAALRRPKRAAAARHCALPAVLCRLRPRTCRPRSAGSLVCTNTRRTSLGHW